MTIFGPSPATVNTIAAVPQTEFAAFAEAVAAIPAITRTVAQKECEFGAIRHIRGDAKLCQFWKAMAQTFY